MDRPGKCQWCKAPHDKIVPITSNAKFYSVSVDGYGTMPNGQYGQVKVPTWFDRKGNPRTDVANNRTDITTERVWLTSVGKGKLILWLCQTCRATFMAKKARMDAKPDPTEPMFGSEYMDEIDAKGKAMKEKRKQARRDMNKPITSGYENEAL